MRIIEYKEDGSYIEEFKESVRNGEFALMVIDKDFVFTTDDFPQDGLNMSNDDIERHLASGASKRRMALKAGALGLNDSNQVRNHDYVVDQGRSI